MNYLLSILIAIKNTPIEFGLSKTKVSLEQHTSLTFDAQNQVIYGYVKVGKYGESSEIKDDKLTKNTLYNNYQRCNSQTALHFNIFCQTI